MNDINKSFVAVNGSNMAYVDRGQGLPIVFLHGNPTSSYLWRNIMPYVDGLGRAIAPDLIGMGDSDKLPDSGPERYTFHEHRTYLDGFLDEIIGADQQIVLVVHDWGSALGFDWAYRRTNQIAGIAFMEAIAAPYASWNDFPTEAEPIFQALRSPAGEEMVLQKNVFVENILPGSILRDLTDAEMAEYRRPFAEPGEGRRPTLTWPRQIPIEGAPQAVADIVQTYSEWLRQAQFPKLFVNAEPGAILRDAHRTIVRAWPNLTEVTVPGIHFIQEDSPDEIGTALRTWISELQHGD